MESPWHWLVVIVVAGLLFFGWKQLPDMARSLGRSLRVFKTEIKGLSEDDKARDAAKTSDSDGSASAPQAIDAAAVQPQKELPRAEVVKNTPSSRPRPTPQGSAPKAGSSSAGQ